MSNTPKRTTDLSEASHNINPTKTPTVDMNDQLDRAFKHIMVNTPMGQQSITEIATWPVLRAAIESAVKQARIDAYKVLWGVVSALIEDGTISDVLTHLEAIIAADEATLKGGE